MSKKVLQWHPGFQAALQIELAEDREYLTFYLEYNLAEKPLQIDTLVIKKEPGHQIQKSFGRMLRHLAKQYQAVAKKMYPGVFYVQGLMYPLQIVVNRWLSPEEHMWLSRLRKNLTIKDDVEVLAKVYKGREHSPLYAAAMDLIIRANQKKYKEAEGMCEALRELFADELIQKWNDGERSGKIKGKEEGKAEGKAESVLDLLMELGNVADDLKEKILAQKNLDVLSSWLRLASKARTIEEFTTKIQENSI